MNKTSNEQIDPTQAEQEYGTHKAHCFMVIQPENEFMGCKYGPDEECPMYRPEPTNTDAELANALEPYRVEMINVMTQTAAEARYDVPESVLTAAIQSYADTRVAEARIEELESVRAIAAHDNMMPDGAGLDVWCGRRIAQLALPTLEHSTCDNYDNMGRCLGHVEQS